MKTVIETAAALVCMAPLYLLLVIEVLREQRTNQGEEQ